MAESASGEGHIIGALPTFFLKGVDAHCLAAKYRAGATAELTLPSEKIIISGSNLAHYSTRDGMENDIYVYLDRFNVLHSVASTNCEAYSLYMQDGTSPPFGGECNWCRYKYAHQAMGIPIRQVIKAKKEKPKEKYHIFYMSNMMFCSFECSLAYIERDISRGYQISNPIYVNSEEILRRLYAMMYPRDPPLIPAPNYLLAQQNGGSLNLSDFRSKNHRYMPVPNVILPPVKLIEEKLDIPGTGRY